MSFQQHLGRIVSRAVLGLVAVAALASCGGSSKQVKPFVPARILTFGDESNSLNQQGLKYSINGLSTTTDQVDCSLNPLWNQVLASAYDFVYANCNTQGLSSPQAFDMSTLNATVDDTATQVSQFLTTDQFNGNDLVTIWVGVHDVLDEYALNGGGGENDTAIADMRAHGAVLANLVNSIVATGAKVILLTIPNMGESPFAYAEQQEHADFDRITLLDNMSHGFNISMRTNIVNDGTKIGLVLADDFVDRVSSSPGSYNIIASPTTTSACPTTSPLPFCNDDAVIKDEGKNSNSPAIYLWADPTHLGPAAHQQIGNEAVSRAQTNPF